MFSLSVLNLDVLSAVAWKRPEKEPAPVAVKVPEAPLTPKARSSQFSPILPGWGL